jgi:2-keto-4-pentenoate hydratase/2-oxohepta-3-ene-1,7-dioic acid hydratase in catechol pathway
MKLVTFRDGAAQCVGAVVEGGVLDLVGSASLLGVTVPTTMQALIDGGPSAWDIARDLVEAAPTRCVKTNARLCAPLPRPVRLRDASLFLEHMEAAYRKTHRALPEEFKRQVIYYNADHIHVFGPDADVPWPRASTWIDYELEWGCVIGHPGANIARSDAARHIFAFTIFNDWSARDLQFAFMSGNLGPGAGKDFANSLGPCIVTVDEFEDPYALAMTARVNGETWSSGTTGSMHWKFEDAIAQLSADRPLVAGEIIGSGTVLGGCGFELDRRLALGDVVELELEGIGILKNKVVPSP